MNLLEISDSYRETGQSFLEESRLLSVLEKYGRVEFEGAFAGNVMLHGDIDIKVIKESAYSSDDIFNIFRDIHDTCGETIRSLFIKADWDDPRFGNQFPNGKYIGLKTYIAEERWKCDIWFISETEAIGERNVLDIAKVELSESQRLQILECKKYRKEHNLKISAQEIYETVLNTSYISPEESFKT
jgi:hypothetical protein